MPVKYYSHHRQCQWGSGRQPAEDGENEVYSNNEEFRLTMVCFKYMYEAKLLDSNLSEDICTVQGLQQGVHVASSSLVFQSSKSLCLFQVPAEGSLLDKLTTNVAKFALLIFKAILTHAIIFHHCTCLRLKLQ